MQINDEKWQPGTQLRLIHDVNRLGTLTNFKIRDRGGRRLFPVRFGNRVDYIYEDQLEPPPEEGMNPLDSLKEGKLGTPGDLRRTLIHVRLTGRLADIIYSMEATYTDFYSYQFKPVLKLLQTPINSILIADEVGLGKTIEAGLIWTELRSRFNMKRLVVLCPAALQEKWCDELLNKIGLSPQVCNAKETLKILKDPQSRTKGFVIISSTQRLRPPRNWENGEETPSDAAELARFLQSNESEERLVDLLVVDEAHHMRNSGTQTNRLGQLMRGVSDFLVLLTATPVHNSNNDLFALLHLLDPDTFRRSDDFGEVLQANAPLIRARDMVLKGGITAAELNSVLDEARASPLLGGNRQLEALSSEITDARLRDRSERSRIAYRLETTNLLGHVVTRTRKREVNEWRVIRRPVAEFAVMTPPEREFYDLVTGVVADYSQDRDANAAFLLVTPQRQMASSMPAALRHWTKRRKKVVKDARSGTDDDREQRELGPLTSILVERSDEFVELETLCASDSKYQKLHEMLFEFFKINSNDKVIIFSTFQETLEYLSERLDADDISNIRLHGGIRRSKEEIIRDFQSPAGPSVLLSSEVGGEGLDLQFAWVVVNYDLPWNPMRVEQRIGRVDRLGQEKETVLIWNLFYADTIDERIYRRLYEKLDLCKHSMGDFELILGDAEKTLTYDLLTGRLTTAQQNARIDQTAQALESKRQDQDRLESEAAHLVAYGDYILEQIEGARDMHRWIGGTDLYAYVVDFMGVHYPGYNLTETDGANHEYELALSAAAKQDLSEFVRKNNLSGQTRLTENTTVPVPCRFENRVLAGAPARKEIISQFHPLVRFTSERISETASQIRPAVSVKLSSQDRPSGFEAGVYVLGVSLWSLRGLRHVERLVYETAMMDNPTATLGENSAEILVNACAIKGHPWLEAKNLCDLGRAHNIANDYLFDALDRRFDVHVKEERAQNEDRADIQKKNLDRNFVRQKDVIDRSIERLRRRGFTKLIPANEGRLKALGERFKFQERKIDFGRVVNAQREEVCVVLALVE